MPNFYLDIETTGIDPSKDKIITIQFVELERNTALQKGNLHILKEWESNEKEILSTFISKSGIADRYPFAFVAVGYNLLFEHKFLYQRSKMHGLFPINILARPFIDLRSLGVIMNRGEFRGSGLDKITNKPHDGHMVSAWYERKEWRSIENYVKVEADEFVRFCSWLYEELPVMLTRFKIQNDIPIFNCKR